MAQRYAAEAEKLKLMLYGQPGSGKTTIAGTAASCGSLGNVLMLESFGNPIALRRLVKMGLAIPDVITIEDIVDFNEPYEWLVKGQDPKNDYVKRFDLNPPYDTLIIDGMTEVQRFVIRKVLGGKNIKPGDLSPKLQRQGFGQVLATMLNWAVHFVKLDMNLILTTLEAKTVVQNEPTYYSPLMWGQAGTEIAGMFYTVGRVIPMLKAPKKLMTATTDKMTSKTHSVMLVHETVNYYGKDQHGMNIQHMCDPTMAKIMDLIERS